VTSDAINELMFWGRLDDLLTVYINGVQAIDRKDWVSTYRYIGISPEARATIRSGMPNTIAVHAHDNGGDKYMDLGLVRVPQLTNPPVSGYAINPALDVVTDFVKEQMSRHGVSAGVVAVGRGRSLVLSRGIGYMDKQFSRAVPHDAVMRLASLDKPPTADVIYRMINMGVVNPHTNQPLTLETRVLDLLASYGMGPVGSLPDQRWRDVTIQQLLNHTSGVASMSEEDYYAVTGVQTAAATIDSNARYLLSKPLAWTPGYPTDEHPYSSTGYMLLRYVAHLLSGNFEGYVQNQLLGSTGNHDMYIAHERIEDRITAADGSLREPWYTTFEQPHDRWIGLDDFTALSSSADAYTLYQLFTPGWWFFYGGMAGTQSVTQEFVIGNDDVAFTAIFNLCCAIPMKDSANAILGMDGKIEELLRGLPESAWQPPVTGVDCKLGSVSTWNNGYVYGDVQITNTSQQTITNWGIQLDFAQPTSVMPVYGYNYTQSGNSVAIRTAFPWNGTLAPGQTWHMSIQGQHGGKFVAPTCKSL
jgi:CubicO group peptidase (beta-lactamase class C family)